MEREPRAVIDPAIIVQRFLRPACAAGMAGRKAIDTATPLLSDALIRKLREMVLPARLDPYVSLEHRQEFMRLVACVALTVPIQYTLPSQPNRGHQDILELAINGNADFILTEDQKLCGLKQFREIPIISPAVLLL